MLKANKFEEDTRQNMYLQCLYITLSCFLQPVIKNRKPLKQQCFKG